MCATVHSDKITHQQKPFVKNWTYEVIVEAIIVVLGILIHPDLGHTNRVLLHYVYSVPPLIGATLAENVSNMRAENDFQNSTTHPDLDVSNGNNEITLKEPSMPRSRHIAAGCTQN